MGCVHVIEQGIPIGNISSDIKDTTMICQECVDAMSVNDYDKTDLPDGVHFYCKECVLEKLKSFLNSK